MPDYALNLTLHDEVELFAEVDQLEEMPSGFLFNGPSHLRFTEEGLLRQLAYRSDEHLMPAL